jgi:hypothetical protein
MLVNVIDTLPAFAVSVLVLYFSWPSGLAERLRACPAPPPAAAGLEGVVVLDVAGAAGVLEAGLVAAVLLEEPQPLTPNRPASSASVETVAIARRLDGAAAFELTVKSSVRRTSGFKTSRGRDPSRSPQGRPQEHIQPAP